MQAFLWLLTAPGWQFQPGKQDRLRNTRATDPSSLNYITSQQQGYLALLSFPSVIASKSRAFLQSFNFLHIFKTLKKHRSEGPLTPQLWTNEEHNLCAGGIDLLSSSCVSPLNSLCSPFSCAGCLLTEHPSEEKMSCWDSAAQALMHCLSLCVL